MNLEGDGLRHGEAHVQQICHISDADRRHKMHADSVTRDDEVQE